MNVRLKKVLEYILLLVLESPLVERAALPSGG